MYMSLSVNTRVYGWRGEPMYTNHINMQNFNYDLENTLIIITSLSVKIFIHITLSINCHTTKEKELGISPPP